MNGLQWHIVSTSACLEASGPFDPYMLPAERDVRCSRCDVLVPVRLIWLHFKKRHGYVPPSDLKSHRASMAAQSVDGRYRVELSLAGEIGHAAGEQSALEAERSLLQLDLDSACLDFDCDIGSRPDQLSRLLAGGMGTVVVEPSAEGLVLRCLNWSSSSATLIAREQLVDLGQVATANIDAGAPIIVRLASATRSTGGMYSTVNPQQLNRQLARINAGFLSLFRSLPLVSSMAIEEVSPEAGGVGGLRPAGGDLVLGSKRRHWARTPGQFYSLWYKGGPVFELMGEQARFLTARRADDPLAFDVVPARRIRASVLPPRVEGTTSASERMFCTDTGRPVPENLLPIIERIFVAVASGTPILARQTEMEVGSLRLAHPSRPVATRQDRQWSQAFLRQLRPDKMINGQLKGSGNRYVAFVFGKLTIVEYDEDAHATYLFRSKGFGELSTWSRRELLMTRPRGYIGRLYHHDEAPGEWKTEIQVLIRRHRA